MTFERAYEIARPLWTRSIRRYPVRLHDDIISSCNHAVWQAYLRFFKDEKHTSVEGAWYKFVLPNVRWAINHAVTAELAWQCGTSRVTLHRRPELRPLVVPVEHSQQPDHAAREWRPEHVLGLSRTWTRNANVRAYVDAVVLGDEKPGQFYKRTGIRQEGVCRSFAKVRSEVAQQIRAARRKLT